MHTRDIAKMVEPFEDRTGYALCILAFMSAELASPVLCVGRIDGTVVPPRGDENSGWYNIFQPKDLHQTLAELPDLERNKHTHRYFACQKLTAYFSSLHPQIVLK
jgi:inosine triphosphate pyrophosphatase